MSTTGFIKGMATGLVVGAAVTMFTDPLSAKERHKIAKKTEGVFKNVGAVIDTAMNAMR